MQPGSLAKPEFFCENLDLGWILYNQGLEKPSSFVKPKLRVPSTAAQNYHEAWHAIDHAASLTTRSESRRVEASRIEASRI